jgi:hypothetical protein
LLLLDGVDTALGQDFLHRLVQSPDAGTSLRPELETPLTVVVTSRGDVFKPLTRVQAEAVRWVTGPAEMSSASTDPDVVWLARRLPFFTAEQIYDLVCKSGLPMASARNLTTMLHQLTGGHPGGTHEVLRALAGAGVALVDVDLEKLLTEGGNPPLGDRILESLLAGFPEDATKHLIFASAGRTEEEGKRLLVRSGGNHVPVPEGMWDVTTPTSLLRVLLLRKLAADPGNWQNAHENLRNVCVGKDPRGELHHLLALGQADEVVQRLVDHLNPDRVSDWLVLLDAVACAPIRDSKVPPILSAAIGPAFVGILLVDTQWVSDPLCGPERYGPYFRVANAYRNLAHHMTDSNDAEGMAEIGDRIDRFDALARQWRRLIPRPNWSEFTH